MQKFAGAKLLSDNWHLMAFLYQTNAYLTDIEKATCTYIANSTHPPISFLSVDGSHIFANAYFIFSFHFVLLSYHPLDFFFSFFFFYIPILVTLQRF